MKAVVATKYGPPEVLMFKEIDIPIPKDNDVLIKIFATSGHIGDSRMRRFDIPGGFIIQIIARLMLGFSGPSRIAKNSILGMDIAGEIVEVGKNVTRFKKGDQVFASTYWSGFGGYAEYKCMPEDAKGLALKPINMTYKEAGVIPAGGITAWGIIKMAKIKKGQNVLIYGASGSVGTFAVQMAKALGADVTGVCSTSNLELVRSLGADTVIDYTQEDFTEGGKVYDVIFDAVDKYKGDYKKALKASGIYLNVDKSSDKIDSKKATSLLNELKELIEAGKLNAVIDKHFPWEEIVEAHRYVDSGRKKGNVSITIVQSE
ncbi:MAG: NAD(P)-dependent alcohol dehydrogenase [Candidatus Heimdallarchaeota archaeon]|nr:MAG: NAD(P)-dependent alcohol dehydrogenase [Candidatus Heimdallarchaeota archaeon]